MADSIEDHPVELSDVLEHAWHLLGLGVADRKHAFHLPVLATTDEEGAAEARTVVLRVADRETRTVACHTDARSPKVAHLRARPWASWVFYDPDSRAQVRVAGCTRVTAVDECAAARTAWERTGPGSRRCYLGPHSPSAPADTPSPNLPSHLITGEPSLEESEAGAPNFRLVTTDVAWIEWLRLRYDGHRRARFSWPDGDEMQATWLEP